MIDLITQLGRLRRTIREIDRNMGALERSKRAVCHELIQQVRDLSGDVTRVRSKGRKNGWVDVVATCDGLLNSLSVIEQHLHQSVPLTEIVEMVSPLYASVNAALYELGRQLQGHRQGKKFRRAFGWCCLATLSCHQSDD